MENDTVEVVTAEGGEFPDQSDQGVEELQQDVAELRRQLQIKKRNALQKEKELLLRQLQEDESTGQKSKKSGKAKVASRNKGKSNVKSAVSKQVVLKK